MVYQKKKRKGIRANPSKAISFLTTIELDFPSTDFLVVNSNVPPARPRPSGSIYGDEIVYTRIAGAESIELRTSEVMKPAKTGARKS